MPADARTAHEERLRDDMLELLAVTMAARTGTLLRTWTTEQLHAAGAPQGLDTLHGYTPDRLLPASTPRLIHIASMLLDLVIDCLADAADLPYDKTVQCVSHTLLAPRPADTLET